MRHHIIPLLCFHLCNYNYHLQYYFRIETLMYAFIFSRIETPQPPHRRGPYGDYYDSRPEPPPRPSSQQSGYQPYDWYRRDDPSEPSTASVSYRPPPPVITEQPRSSIVPQHFQPFDRAYPKTLESLAEKVHTFHTGPRPSKQNGPSRMRIPRTGSDHRITLGRAGDQQNWYGSMPRQRTTPDYSHSGRPGVGLPHSTRYTAGKKTNACEATANNSINLLLHHQVLCYS